MKPSKEALTLLAVLAGTNAALATTTPPTYDYIIVGGGTSGLVIANRLSADPSVSVAVVEAGGSVLHNPNVTTVGTFGLGLGTDIDWQYTSASQKYAGGKTVAYDQGKALAGTSAINGMTYVRPQKAQLDSWTTLGNEGWSWSSLWPYYLNSERFQPPTPAQRADGETYDPSDHGYDGPLYVGWLNKVLGGKTPARIQQAWAEVGYAENIDVNGGNLDGFGHWPMTLNRKENIRWDAARAYYWPVADRKNLHVYLNTTVKEIQWSASKKNDGLVATGVTALHFNESSFTLCASREIVLSAGAIKSPAILEQSGVGNPAVLGPLGIKTRYALPGVGENLQDQANVPLIASAHTLSGANFSGYPTFVTNPTAAQLFGSNLSNVEKYVRSSIPAYAAKIASQAAPGGTTTAAQEHLLGILADQIFKHKVPVAEILTATAENIFDFPNVGVLPFSRGSVHITSPNSSSWGMPAINPNFFMLDWDVMLQAATMRVSRDAQNAKALKGIVVKETMPGLKTVPADATDAQWFTYIKQSFGANWHPVGSCIMLPENVGGVVSPDAKVYGTANVRVVDASILPTQVQGHLTSTLYAVAERLAAMMTGQTQTLELRR